MARKYTKKSEYWSKFKSQDKSLEDLAKSAADKDLSTAPILLEKIFMQMQATTEM